MAGQLFAGLFTTQPGKWLPSGEEPAWIGYARQPVEIGADGCNVSRVRFPPVTAKSRIVGAGIFDAEVGGNLVSLSYLAIERDVSPGDVCVFPPGEIAGRPV